MRRLAIRECEHSFLYLATTGKATEVGEDLWKASTPTAKTPVLMACRGFRSQGDSQELSDFPKPRMKWEIVSPLDLTASNLSLLQTCRAKAISCGLSSWVIV